MQVHLTVYWFESPYGCLCFPNYHPLPILTPLIFLSLIFTFYFEQCLFFMTASFPSCHVLTFKLERCVGAGILLSYTLIPLNPQTLTPRPLSPHLSLGDKPDSKGDKWTKEATEVQQKAMLPFLKQKNFSPVFRSLSSELRWMLGMHSGVELSWFRPGSAASSQGDNAAGSERITPEGCTAPLC